MINIDFFRFIDSRDNENLISTHIYLLIGCAFPFIDNYPKIHLNFQNYIIWISGCLILGIGDSFVI